MSPSITNSEANGKSAGMKVAIIGAGLVGSLAALNFARMGNEVHLYEYREDIRTAELVQGRSINLALSQRGRKALAAVGLEQQVLATAIPMQGRMLHDVRGRTSVVLYDPCTKQCLYSVGRKQLNEVLLNACEKLPNISCHFNHKLTSADIREGVMQFKRRSAEEHITASADLIVGCDGAFSKVRQHMVKAAGFNYSQQYIEHGYVELCIPAKSGEFQMPPNYLHIWPRDTFMMIALPNQDKSFTVTLFMPFKNFAAIKTPEQLLEFFNKFYADAVPLIGEERLVQDFFKLKPQYLLSVKCQPYHFSDKALILGDAAHAMVPYYGQGMNAGMEDVTLLTSLLNKPLKLQEVLEQFSEMRWQDAHTICDLALYNYVEMRDLTKRWSFRCRKWLDTLLFRLFPIFWVPLYNSVSFTSMPYSKCIANRNWQDRFLKRSFAGALLAGLAAYLGALYFRGLHAS